jgi:hypothetical protein
MAQAVMYGVRVNDPRPRALHAGLTCFAAIVVACGDPERVLGPTNDPPPAPPVLVSGTVYEHGPSGPRPLASMPLYVVPGVQSVPAARSDANGRYSISTSSGAHLFVRAEAGAYYQPCRAGAYLAGDTAIDVHLVPRAVLSTSGVPVSVPIAEPYVTGRVFEVTAQGEVPIRGAVVSGTPQEERIWGPSVSTLTDAFGRYVLCGSRGMFELVASAAEYFFERAIVDLSEGPAATHDFSLWSLWSI